MDTFLVLTRKGAASLRAHCQRDTAMRDVVHSGFTWCLPCRLHCRCCSCEVCGMQIMGRKPSHSCIRGTNEQNSIGHLDVYGRCKCIQLIHCSWPPKGDKWMTFNCYVPFESKYSANVLFVRTFCNLFACNYHFQHHLTSHYRPFNKLQSLTSPRVTEGKILIQAVKSLSSRPVFKITRVSEPTSIQGPTGTHLAHSHLLYPYNAAGSCSCQCTETSQAAVIHAHSKLPL